MIKRIIPSSTRAINGSLNDRRSGSVVLRLFVAGANVRSLQAILYVRHLSEIELKGRCMMEVIDIYQQPQLARTNQIVATPTLIREYPRPVRRYIGNLASIDDLILEMRRAPGIGDPR